MICNFFDKDKLGGSPGRVPERSEVAEAQQWNLTLMFADPSEWDAEFDRIDSLVEPLEAMRGELGSAAAIARAFEVETELDRLLKRLFVYAQLKEDEDTGNTDSQGRSGRIRAKLAEVAGRLAWMTPEILSHPEEDLRAWTDSEELKADRFEMVKLLRRKPHTLSDREETLLSRAGEVFAAPQRAFQFLVDADMKFPEIKNAAGEACELSIGRYLIFLIDSDRRVRRDAFEAMYNTFKGYRNTISSTLGSHVKLQNYMARTRAFPSALEASLHSDHVPPALYESLIQATHDAFAHFYRYLELRQSQLGVERLDMYDMYVPIVPEYEVKVEFEQARQWILDACQPLGEDYVRVLHSAFTDRWIDACENRGKRNGAYSSGCYDSLPYILMNYQGTLDNVFTLAHELGHSMHTYLANQTQPPRFADYPIFTAEIPSTLNEGLLLKHLLDTNDDPRFRAYLLNHLCDSYKATVYRQTMFAEFEKLVHEMDAAGTPLTPDTLAEAYYKMNGEYYGPAVKADERISWEWSRVPHFYYNFYVYKYATSFCASQIFVRRVLESEAQRDQYLDLLRSGGSADPLELIGRAGVDLTDRATLESAFASFAETVTELDGVLEELG